jgi:hypothetical protein
MASRVDRSILCPATWAEDGFWGRRTPIHRLNRIIQLQAVAETVTNETAKPLRLTKQLKYQHHLPKPFGFGLFASLGGWGMWKVQSE